MSALDASLDQYLKGYIRDIPDFLEPGILFRDITPLLGDAQALRATIDGLAAPFTGTEIDHIVGIESRGFLFGMPLAYRMATGFVPVRKHGKLPHHTIAQEYALEYGTNIVEVHADALRPGQRVIIVDDLLATGGTALAAVKLMQALGAQVVGLAFVIELTALGGRAQLGSLPIHVLVRY